MIPLAIDFSPAGREQYNRIAAPALAEYKRIEAPAWAECYINEQEK